MRPSEMPCSSGLALTRLRRELLPVLVRGTDHKVFDRVPDGSLLSSRTVSTMVRNNAYSVCLLAHTTTQVEITSMRASRWLIVAMHH